MSLDQKPIHPCALVSNMVLDATNVPEVPRIRNTIIKGARHTFFGRYGSQKGDGIPTITREQTDQQILETIESFLTKLP